MLNILHQPTPISYSLNLRDIELETDSDLLHVTLYHAGQVVLDEEYTPNPAGQLTLRFAELVHSLLYIDVPSFSDGIYVQDRAIGNFKVEISNDHESKEINFTAVKGYRSIEPGDLDSFFKNNWLTSMPQRNAVVLHQPLYLTAYVDKSVTVRADFTLNDGSSRSLDLYTLSANKVQTINLNPGLLIQQLEDEFQSVSLYGQSGSDRYFFTQSFYLSRQNLYDSFFIYENRLGGIDSIRAIGDQVSKRKFESKSGLRRLLNVDYDQNRSAEIEKNIGYIKSIEHENQIAEFLYSPAKYVYHQGAVHKIIVTSSELKTTSGALDDFAFTYIYADRRNIYPELEITPSHLII